MDDTVGRSAPRVSFVVASRNDDHGGSPLRRTALFLRTLDELCRRHRLVAELVIVEWNPPADRVPLRDALDWPSGDGALPVRILTVPREVHARMPNAERIPFFQMIAKNVGIRRARGDFVAVTNIDILFSDGLIEFLACGPLDPSAVYRVERLDLALRDLPDELDLDERLALASFQVARRNDLRETHGIAAGDARREFGHGADTTPSGNSPGAEQRIAAALADAVWPWPFFNACGDFTMLASEQWFALRGHAELPLYSLHLDSILLARAMAHGLRQIVLGDPARSYHIEHGMGWNVVDDREAIVRDRPVLSYTDLLDHLEAIQRDGPAHLAAAASWGLAGVALTEWRSTPRLPHPLEAVA